MGQHTTSLQLEMVGRTRGRGGGHCRLTKKKQLDRLPGQLVLGQELLLDSLLTRCLFLLWTSEATLGSVWWGQGAQRWITVAVGGGIKNVVFYSTFLAHAVVGWAQSFACTHTTTKGRVGCEGQSPDRRSCSSPWLRKDLSIMGCALECVGCKWRVSAVVCVCGGRESLGDEKAHFPYFQTGTMCSSTTPCNRTTASTATHPKCINA